MDRSVTDPPLEEPDSAELAFQSLRDEVLGQRIVLERIAGVLAGAQSLTSKAPDYSPTLGAIAKELQGVTARLAAIERMPVLSTEPAAQAAAFRRELFQLAQETWRPIGQSQAALDGAVRELRGMMSGARDRYEQDQWLWTAGAVGVLFGAALWFLATALLPWGAGTWLGGLAYGGRWNAGEVMLRAAAPESWERMVRLYNACPKESSTELCEAELAVQAAGGKELRGGSHEPGTGIEGRRPRR